MEGGGRRFVDVSQAPAGGRTWRCTGRHAVLTSAVATTRSTHTLATLHTKHLIPATVNPLVSLSCVLSVSANQHQVELESWGAREEVRRGGGGLAT